MRFVIVLILVAAVSGLAYIRLAPHDVETVHQPIDADGNEDFAIGARRVVPATQGDFERIIADISQLPRTKILAGSKDSGLVTFVTRSAAFGFPDYTTVQWRDGTIRLYARLRFGGSDLGVNRERLEGVLARLELG